MGTTLATRLNRHEHFEEVVQHRQRSQSLSRNAKAVATASATSTTTKRRPNNNMSSKTMNNTTTTNNSKTTAVASKSKSPIRGGAGGINIGGFLLQRHHCKNKDSSSKNPRHGIHKFELAQADLQELKQQQQQQQQQQRYDVDKNDIDSNGGDDAVHRRHHDTQPNGVSSESSSHGQLHRRICTSVENLELCDARGRCGVYSGQIDATTSLPHGRGLMKYHVMDDGRHQRSRYTYDGRWYDGCWSGYGAYTVDTSPKGGTTYYQGPFLDNHKHGLFVARFEDGRVYDGAYKMDKIQRGHMDIPLVGRYYGDFDEHNQPHGRGKLLFIDGRRYDGEFCHGRISGHGRMVYGNLRMTDSSNVSANSSLSSVIDFGDSSYSTNRSNGDSDSDSCGDSGAYTDTDKRSNWSLNSSINVNNFIEGKMDSSSRSVLASVAADRATYSFYLGSFANGKRSGEGILMIDEQIIHEGHWYDDEPVGWSPVAAAPVAEQGRRLVNGKIQRLPQRDTCQPKRCLGRIPAAIKPSSRFSPKKKNATTTKIDDE